MIQVATICYGCREASIRWVSNLNVSPHSGEVLYDYDGKNAEKLSLIMIDYDDDDTKRN